MSKLRNILVERLQEIYVAGERRTFRACAELMVKILDRNLNTEKNDGESSDLFQHQHVLRVKQSVVLDYFITNIDENNHVH